MVVGILAVVAEAEELETVVTVLVAVLAQELEVMAEVLLEDQVADPEDLVAEDLIKLA